MGGAPPLLILGGTGEAAALAAAAVGRLGRRLRVVSSLAGRSRSPRPLPGEVRVGGFGGAAGLARYLAAEGVRLVVDATHPFAARISANAAHACAAAGVPRLVLDRPPWTPRPGDDWRSAPDLDSAAGLLPDIADRVLLTVGSRDLAAFAGVAGVRFVVRVLEAPAAPLPLPDCTVVVGRGPFTVAGERALLRSHAIGALVAKNSGGPATAAKLAAARAEGVPVVMVARPAPVPGPRVRTVDEVLRWIETQLADPDAPPSGP